MSDPDDTFRTLAGQPVPVRRVWCRVGFHLWTPWSEAKKVAWTAYYVQESSCVVCNQSRIRKIKEIS